MPGVVEGLARIAGNNGKFVFINDGLVNEFGPFHISDVDMQRLLGIDSKGLMDIPGRLRCGAIHDGLEQDNPLPRM